MEAVSCFEAGTVSICQRFSLLFYVIILAISAGFMDVLGYFSCIHVVGYTITEIIPPPLLLYHQSYYRL